MAEDWFAEPAYAGLEQRYRVLDRLHAETTPWQTLEVLDLEGPGRSLILAGTLQTSVGEEFTYHEPLVHIPMFAHPNPHRVLIVGGGDGGALRHVLLHPGVDRALEVEIDQVVVQVALRFLPEISRGAYSDPRSELKIQDAVQFVAETAERFDVVLIDSTDPVGPAAALISDQFLNDARRVLAPGGLIAMQSGSPISQPREWLATVAAVKRAFTIVRPYLGYVPIYPAMLWSWVIGSLEIDPMSIDEVSTRSRLDKLRSELRIYNTGVHRAAFALPTFMQTLLQLTERDESPTPADLRAAGHPLPGVIA
ncbi:MAG: polyamine aminopropyltransferase [Chloroflexota bacterium]|nr:polyamine aminopropyltransferase [Chloroflexota bacterium]